MSCTSFSEGTFSSLPSLRSRFRRCGIVGGASCHEADSRDVGERERERENMRKFHILHSLS